jgi:hypothetical protein
MPELLIYITASEGVTRGQLAPKITETSNP